MNWKSIAFKIYTKTGYRIYKVGQGKEYNPCPPYDYWTYSPWFEDWFQRIYAKARKYTKVTEDRCYIIHKFCLHCLNLQGDFAECGVYKGGSAYVISQTLAQNGLGDRLVHLFDTFAGMPAIANKDPSGVKEGWFGDNSLSAVKEYLKDFPFVVFYPGFIPDTLEPVKDKRFAFVHIDVDLYQTTLDCCNFFYPRMTGGGSYDIRRLWFRSL